MIAKYEQEIIVAPLYILTKKKLNCMHGTKQKKLQLSVRLKLCQEIVKIAILIRSVQDEYMKNVVQHIPYVFIFTPGIISSYAFSI
jgi:hypothetical protein